MTRHLLRLGLVVVAALGPRAAASPQQSAPAAVSGVVTDGATNQPVPGAFVEILRTDAGKTTTQRVEVDSKGRFVFTDLQPGAGYSLTAGGTGYVQTEFGWEPGAADSLARDRLTFRLANGEWKRDLVMRIWRRGTIGGRVVDEHAQPVVGVAVRAYTVVFTAGVQRFAATGAIATTDDRGVYRLSNLEPGTYKVGVLSVQATVPPAITNAPQERPIGGLVFGIRAGTGVSAVDAPVIDGRGAHRLAVTNFATPPPPADGRSRAYPAIYYPAVHSLAEAQPIAVTWGTDRAGIDLQLRPAPAFVVSGRFDGSLSGPLFLRLLPAGLEYLGVGSEAATTSTEKDGAFTFLNVPAGNYTLIGQGPILEMMTGPGDSHLPDPPGYASAGSAGMSWSGAPSVHFVNRRGVPTSSFVRRSISVADDTSDLIIPISTTGSIRGRVIYTNGSVPPVANTFLPISLEPLDGDPSLGNPRAYVDDTAAFAIDGVLPGRYRLYGSGRVISSIVSRGRDVADTGIEITAGESIDDVVITFTGKPAGLVATVIGLAPETRAAVIVFPAARDQWANFGWNPPRIASGNTNTNGVVEFARLPAGDYLVVAVELSKAYAWTDPRFLAAASLVASRVTVGWAESKPLMLKVERVIVR